MNRQRLFSLLLLFLALSARSLFAQNLVVNGGFEAGVFINDTGISLPGGGSSGSSPTLPGSDTNTVQQPSSGTNTSGSTPPLPGLPGLPGSGSSGSSPPLPGTTTTNLTTQTRMSLPDGSTAITNWVAGVGIGYVRWLKSPDFNAQDGAYAVSLHSSNTAPFSFIEQTIPTISGQIYDLSAFLSSDGNGGPSVVSILVNGTIIGSVTNGSGAAVGGPSYTNLVWTPASLRFQATASTSTIRFQDATPNGDFGPILDNIAVRFKAPQIGLRVVSGRPELTLASPVGGRFRAEASSSLTNSWSTLSTFTIGSTPSVLTDPQTNSILRFYRAIPIEP